MSDFQKAGLLAFLAVFGFLIWITGELRYLKPHMAIVLHGSASPTSPYTNIEAFAGLILGLFLAVLGACFRIVRRIGNRELGQHLNPATRDVRHGV
ncbi:MAG: hypothetical protein M3Z85_01355, partial [Acidobacteriota bacterium]|nr:hypothetical protein [Acidobacteriota bacterium]